MKNYKIFYIICFLIVGIFACTNQEKIPNHLSPEDEKYHIGEQATGTQIILSNTPTPTKTKVLTPTGTTTPILIPTDTPTQTSTYVGMRPEIKKYCPENREVNLADLGIDQNIGMVVDYQDSNPDLYDSSINQNGLYLLSGLDSEMISIPGTIPSSGWNYVYNGINADRKWLLLEKWEVWEDQVSVRITSTKDQGEREILTVRFDGNLNSFKLGIASSSGNNWTIGPMSRGWGTQWVGNEIELYGKYIDSVAMDPIFPFFYINPFTLDGIFVDISKLYEGVSSPYGEISFDGQGYVIYYGNFDDDFQHKEFILQDKENYSKTEIFKWLRKADWIDNNELFGRFRLWISNSGNVNMAIVQDYGFDLGKDIDLQGTMSESVYELIWTFVRCEFFNIGEKCGHCFDGDRS